MKKAHTIVLMAILIIAGCSFLSYWWTKDDISNPNNNRVVDVYGLDPFSMGFQYGQKCKSEIQGLCSMLGLVDSMFSAVANFKSIHLTLLVQPYIPQEYRLEMCGVAFGAGVTYNQIFFLNMMADYMQLLEKTAFQCSQFIVVNNTNPLNGPMLARTLDYLGDLVLDRYQVIIRWHPYPGAGNMIIGHTIVGMIGYLTGINDQGLTIGVSQIAPYWDIGPGMSCTLAIRDVLQHNTTTIEAAKTFGDLIPKTMGGWCFAILDKQGSAAIVELSNNFNDTIWKGDLPFLAITNHYISLNGSWRCSYRQQSEARLETLTKLLPLNPAFDFASVIALLRNHYDSITGCYNKGYNSICNHGMYPVSGTMGAFIANPKNGVALFCFGAPCESDFYMITFDPINYLIGPVA